MDLKDLKEITMNEFRMQEARRILNGDYDECYKEYAKEAKEDAWEKGVRDAWDYLRSKAKDIESDASVYGSRWGKITHILDDLDPVIYTIAFVRNRDKDEDDGFNEGDIVTDFAGEECIITHVEEESIAVVYYDGKVENWMPNTLTKTGKRGCVSVKVPDEDGEEE